MATFPTIHTIAVLALVAALPSAAIAHPGGWGGTDWGGTGLGDPDMRDSDPGLGARDRSREGKITVARFVSQDPLAAGLGHGDIAIAMLRAGERDFDQLDRATFEAAFVDRLNKAGYSAKLADADAVQVIELTVVHTELEPPGAPHKPVSGEASIGASNRGMGYSLAIGIDLSKPLPPLISTRVEARIRDRATRTILWEGRAEVATRPGAKGWTSQQTAARLAAALLAGFPHASDGIGRPS